MRDLFSSLEIVGQTYPGSIAIASPAGHINYGQFLANIGSVAIAAKSNGIKPGTFVYLAVQNSDFAYILALALLRLGCRVGFAEDWSTYEANQVSVDAIIADRKIDAGDRRVIVADSSWLKSGASASSPVVEDDCSLITSSSGSTGTPKLIETSAAAILRWLNCILSEELTVPGMRSLTLVGDRLRGGFCESIATHLRGGMLIRARDRRGETILDTIQTYCPDYIAASPYVLHEMVRTLLDTPREIDKVERLRSVGAYCAPELQNACLAHLAHDVFSTFGSTECGWIARGSAKDLQKVPNSVGRIYDDVDVGILGDEGQLLPIGTPGEIAVKQSEGLIGRYLHSDFENQQVADDRWFATGDVGAVDSDNNLIIVGRADNVINTGGDKINPEILEQQIMSLPDISDAGVAGVPVPEGFETVCALIVTSASIGRNQVNEVLKKRLLWPVDTVKTVGAIPRTGNGKIDRVALKRLALNIE
jgi:acyl-coenzyme A synthetase/AMP-(fatty) acid ligase